MSRTKTLSAVLALYTGDALIKKYMVHHLEKGKEKPICGGRAVLHRLENPGAALGLGKNHQKLLNLTVAAFLGGMGVQLARDEGTGMEKTALVLLTAGGLGNLTDRALQGYVDDYMRIPCKHKKLSRVVFNLADIFVAAGACLTVAASLQKK